eukprot:2146415-Rhodomonas_salina.2
MSSTGCRANRRPDLLSTFLLAALDPKPLIALAAMRLVVGDTDASTALVPCRGVAGDVLVRVCVADALAGGDWCAASW